MNIPILQIKTINDERGNLCFAEYPSTLPFEAKRVFYFFDCPEGVIRGNHAHKKSRQVHICMEGSVTFTLDNGTEKTDIILDRPNTALIIEPMIWHSLVMGKGARLFVLSSDTYDEKDYIRYYTEFETYTKK
jgi:dTDP-4-dehydrorhamnose 3,5-epimerase-like enzyme